VVEEPARRRDDDVDASAERGLLRAHADTAIHRGAGEAREAGKIPAMLVDLRGQLPRGRDDERARDAARLAVDVLQDREQECRRLAAARHGAGEDVPAIHRRGDRVLLDRGRHRESHLVDAAQEVGVKVERGEGHSGRFLLGAPGPVQSSVREHDTPNHAEEGAGKRGLRKMQAH
jgi:hypothetical protein